MKRYFFTLILSLLFTVTLDVRSKPAQSSVSFTSTAAQEWLHGAKALDKEYQKKLIAFLDSMCRLLPHNTKSEQKSIEKAINRVITNTKNQIEKIKIFMRLTSREKDSFSLKETVKSLDSEQSKRLDAALALEEIMIEDPALLKMIKQIDNSTQHSSTEHIVDTIEEEERFLHAIERFQQLIHNNFENSLETCSFLKKEITGYLSQQESFSQKNSSSTLWDSIVKAFQVHY